MKRERRSGWLRQGARRTSAKLGGALLAGLLIIERIIRLAPMLEDAPRAIRFVVDLIDSVSDILVGFVGGTGLIILVLRWEDSIAERFRRTINRFQSTLWTLEASLWGTRVSYWITTTGISVSDPPPMQGSHSFGRIRTDWMGCLVADGHRALGSGRLGIPAIRNERRLVRSRFRSSDGTRRG